MAHHQTEQSGGCLCGAVRFVARDVPGTLGICHCPTCRRWTGSALLGVSVPEGRVTFEDETHLSRFQSSEWAERAFCSRCGSNLFFRMTEDSKWSGKIEFPLGVFDDPSGFEISHEIYIDHKPDSFAFASAGHKQLTRAECVAQFPRLDS